jgi:hypothetical protein
MLKMLALYKTEDLPKDATTCGNLKDKANYFIQIMYLGKNYYLPLTNEMKKALGLSIRGGRLLHSRNEFNIEGFLRDVISAVYLQIRDTVGVEIHQTLSKQITEGMEKMFEDNLYKSIEGGLNQKLLPRLPGEEK